MFCCLQRLREEILIMKKYFVTCREALESKLLLQVCMRHESASVIVRSIWRKLSRTEKQNCREKRNTSENCS